MPLIDGATVALRATVSSVPPDGVLFTVKAVFERFAAAARSSSNWMYSDVPNIPTHAELTVGAVPGSFTSWTVTVMVCVAVSARSPAPLVAVTATTYSLLPAALTGVALSTSPGFS